MQEFLSFGVGRDEYYHELVLDEEMVKAKGKGLKKAKNAKESVDDVSGSDTESALRQAILDNTRQDPLDTEASGSGLNQNEDVNDGEDDILRMTLTTTMYRRQLRKRQQGKRKRKP